MARKIDTKTLDQAAKDYATHFNLPTIWSPIKDSKLARGGRDWPLQSLYNMHYADEHAYLIDKFRRQLGVDPLEDFNAVAAKLYTPRDPAVFEALLAEKLAIDPNGQHIPGKIGTVVFGSQSVGRRLTRHGVKNASWNVYAGELEERRLGNVRERGTDGPGADPLPPAGVLWPNETEHLGDPAVLMALNTNVSIAFAIAGLDAARILLDEGTGIGVIQGRTLGQPVDPDAGVTGVLLFTLGLAAIALGAAADVTPGARSTAGTIVDDTSADATDTLTYCRASSTNDGVAPLNDHIDGSAGTATFDFVFNTVAIVSGAVVEMTSWTATQPQGPTAT